MNSQVQPPGTPVRPSLPSYSLSPLRRRCYVAYWRFCIFQWTWLAPLALLVIAVVGATDAADDAVGLCDGGRAGEPPCSKLCTTVTARSANAPTTCMLFIRWANACHLNSISICIGNMRCIKENTINRCRLCQTI